jgi:hypothetical protein
MTKDAPTLRTLALRVLAENGTARGTVAGQRPENAVPLRSGAGTGKTEPNQRDSRAVPLSHALGSGTWDSAKNNGTSCGTVAGQSTDDAGHDRGVFSGWAEALAKLSRQRRPPDDVSYRQWDALRDDFTRFCGRWATQAEALGWRPRDLLGWDPRYPYTPIAKRLGLAWKFEGAAVVEVRRDAIVVERLHGFRATLPRRWTI